MTKALLTLLIICVTNLCQAQDTPAIVSKISQHLVKVKVELADGDGLGSGVVVSNNQIVTNCHVVADALSVKVIVNGDSLNVSGLIPDWQHDVCILVVDQLKAPVATIGNSEQLHYEQPLFAMGFAGDTKLPHASYGYVKGLYPMDDSVIVRASNTFNVGDSGGGVFDEAGNLVAIIDVKSPGRSPNYYNLSVAWIKKLMQQPVQNMVNTRGGASPFWAKTGQGWPYFMRVVHPLKTKNWSKLGQLADEWATAEPNTTEAAYYQGIAAFKMHQLDKAYGYLARVFNQNKLHTGAVYLLGLIADQKGNAVEAKKMLTILESINTATAKNLRGKIKLTQVDA